MKIETVTLDGQYVTLRPLRLDDAEALWLAGSDPGLWQFTSVKINSVEDMRRYVRTAVEEQERGVLLPFATIHKASSIVVGTTRFGSIVKEHKRVEIGWTFVGTPRQRTAVNTEA